MYSPNTFIVDRLIRTEQGMPIGRIVLFDDNDFELGKPVKISILKVPVQFNLQIIGLEFYIDGVKYRIPEDLPEVKCNKNNADWFVSSTIIYPV